MLRKSNFNKVSKINDLSMFVKEQQRLSFAWHARGQEFDPPCLYKEIQGSAKMQVLFYLNKLQLVHFDTGCGVRACGYCL